jgi:dihydrofolate reductase
MRIHVIAACSLNRVIGRRGTLPWSIRTDWEYFLSQIQGHVSIMGRISYREFPASADRPAILVSKTAYDQRDTLKFAHTTLAMSYDHALEVARSQGFKMVWICGGERIYEQALPTADQLYLTRVNMHVDEGDTFFPHWQQHLNYLKSRRVCEEDGIRYNENRWMRSLHSMWRR